MNTFLTIFKKELIDTIRDRRTIIAMIIIPLLLFPVIFGVWIWSPALIQPQVSGCPLTRISG